MAKKPTTTRKANSTVDINMTESDWRHLLAFSRVVNRFYGNWWYLIGRAIVAGLFAALGATIGLAIVVWLLSSVLESLGVLPVIGDFFVKANELLQTYTSTPPPTPNGI